MRRVDGPHGVEGVALGDAAEVDGHTGRAEARALAVACKLEALPAHMAARGRDLLRRGHAGAVGADAPERDERARRHVKGAVRARGPILRGR